MSKKLKIFFIGDIKHPNAINWLYGLELYGNCNIETFSLYHSPGVIGKIKRIIHWMWALYFLKYKIKKYNPDVVIGYRVPSNGFLAAFTGVHPLVVASQGRCDIWPPNHWTTPYKKKLAQYALKNADLVQAWAPHMADCLFSMGATPEKTLILPRGIDVDLFSFSNFDTLKTLKIISTRSLEPEYRHIIILKALLKLKNENIHFSFSIIGNGSMRPELEEFVKDNNLSDKIHFLGKVNNHDLPRLLQESNIYISMPLTEGVSASLLEAMACGCYPIVSDLDANQQWITNNKNGNLIPCDDIDSLYSALSNLAYNKEYWSNTLTENRHIVEEKGNLKINISKFVSAYSNLKNN